MSLSMLSGPPGSGREERLLETFVALADRDPVLVVPTTDDVDRLERALCVHRSGGLLGGTVTTFPGLFGEIRRAMGGHGRPAASRVQRLWLARAAARRTRLGVLRRSAARTGFAPALEALIADLQGAGLDAAGLRAATAELDDGRYEREICDLLATYERLRDAAGLGDEAELWGRATAMLRADPRPWRARPVLLLGFDDLTRRQVELVAALGGACEVTIAITFEPERAALAARAGLRGTLVDELGATELAALPRRPRGSAETTLDHLERHLFEPDPPTREPDGSLRLLEGAGARNEAELIGRRIARLLAGGTDPGDIAIAVRVPDRQAPLIARVLAGLGVPVAPEARIPLAATATGSALLTLLAIAGPEGRAEEVVAFLRGPARARPDAVDWLERRVLRGRLTTAAEALEAWRGTGTRERRIWELDALREAGEDPGELARVLARLAADIAQRPHLRSGFVPSSGPAVELRAAAEVGRALSDTAALGEQAPAAGELTELLEGIRVPMWRGSAEGRVRILSPYRLRATRLEHLFVAGLADGSFPGRAPADPLLPDERRAALGLSTHGDQAAEERYLFYRCVALPDRSLHLSYPVSDEAGHPVPRSAFVDDVRALLAPEPSADPADDELEAQITDRPLLGVLAPRPLEATSPRDLARALAAHPIADGEPAELGLPPALLARASADVERAREALAAASEPGPLRDPHVLAELATERAYGASTLEEYDTCPYRWFVGHELDPQPLGPDPEPLEDGGLVHEVLERLYKAPPTAHPSPREEDVSSWERAARSIIRDVAAERGWDLAAAGPRIRTSRFEAALGRFLRRDAASENALEPDRDLLEASFGRGPGDRFEAASLGDFTLHGRIDRIDVAAGGQALIRDYKLSSKAVAGTKLVEEGKLQMPLYLLAARSFGLDPVGGLYSPLGASRDDRPRGLMNKDFKGTLLAADTASCIRTDFLPPDAFEEILETARARAGEIVAGIRSGEVTRAPRGDECPSWCTMAAICRIERGVSVEDPEAEEELAS